MKNLESNSNIMMIFLIVQLYGEIRHTVNATEMTVTKQIIQENNSSDTSLVITDSKPETKTTVKVKEMKQVQAKEVIDVKTPNDAKANDQEIDEAVPPNQSREEDFSISRWLVKKVKGSWAQYKALSKNNEE